MNQSEKDHKTLMQAVAPFIGRPITEWDGKRDVRIGTVVRGDQSQALRNLANTFPPRY